MQFFVSINGDVPYIVQDMNMIMKKKKKKIYIHVKVSRIYETYIIN
jgi:hypothetical protein